VVDKYFDDFDDGNSWNATSFNWNMTRNTNGVNEKRQLPISLNGQSSNMPVFFIV
jgi:hypothetical protein